MSEERLLDPDWRPYPVGYDESTMEELMDMDIDEYNERRFDAWKTRLRYSDYGSSMWS